MEAQPTIFKKWEDIITEKGFTVVSKDYTRPWGGFLVLDENQAGQFIDTYFPGYTKEELMIGAMLSPKILLVAPEKRLSWQYHHRRAEIWRVVEGPVKVAISGTDEETAPQTYHSGDIIQLSCGDRHRLIGAENFGVIAEIWQHTDPAHPSDEQDIIRVQDDFGR